MAGRTLTVAIAAACLHAACGSKSPSTPSPTPTTPSAPTVTTTAVVVSGTAPRVGDTAQFTASATLSDGTSRTVTSQAVWQSSNAGVATVSPAGVVTGVGEGDVDISATYENVRGAQRVSVAVRLFALSGTITDVSDGRPIAGAAVEVIGGENAGRASDPAGADGRYLLGNLRPGTLRLRARGPGHDFGDQSVTIGTGDARADFALRVTAVPRVASYDPVFKAPSCDVDASSCDSGSLLRGRYQSEANWPNTVFSSCSDGSGVGLFSLVQAIRVATTDGSVLAAGKSVQVSVDYAAFTTAARLVVSYAPDANALAFTQIGSRLGAAPSLTTPLTVTFTVTLGSGATQVFRAATIFDVTDDDCDDLVIRVR